MNIENVAGTVFGDVLYGNTGSNTIKGGAGNDFIVGGAGSDALYGGADSDVFRFEVIGYGNDVIVDYQDGLDHLSFNTTIASNASAFTISGNDSLNVTVTMSGQILTIQGATAIHIDANDFIFVSKFFIVCSQVAMRLLVLPNTSKNLAKMNSLAVFIGYVVSVLTKSSHARFVFFMKLPY